MRSYRVEGTKMSTLIRSWRKSSYSNGTGAACVESGLTFGESGRDRVVGVRDSKLPTVGEFPMLAVGDEDWAGLLRLVRS